MIVLSEFMHVFYIQEYTTCFIILEERNTEVIEYNIN